ncbi:hypothetical protein Gotur_028245 [Gossypium turneri]
MDVICGHRYHILYPSRSVRQSGDVGREGAIDSVRDGQQQIPSALRELKKLHNVDMRRKNDKDWRKSTCRGLKSPEAVSAISRGEKKATLLEEATTIAPAVA